MKNTEKYILLGLKFGLTDEKELKEFSKLIGVERLTASAALRLIIERRIVKDERRKS